MPIRRGPVFASPEGSQFCQSGGVLFLPIRREPNFGNPEGSCFCQSGWIPSLPIRRVLFLTIRRGPVFANPKGPSQFCQSGGVLYCQNLSGHKKVNSKRYQVIRRGTVFAIPEGSCFCQSGGVPFLPIRRGTILLRLK